MDPSKINLRRILVHHIDNVFATEQFPGGRDRLTDFQHAMLQWPHHDRGRNVLLANRQEISYVGHGRN